MTTSWASLMLKADELERLADGLRDKALVVRCPSEDSGGARCTADNVPGHAHRYDSADLPRYAGIGYERREPRECDTAI